MLNIEKTLRDGNDIEVIKMINDIARDGKQFEIRDLVTVLRSHQKLHLLLASDSNSQKEISAKGNLLPEDRIGLGRLSVFVGQTEFINQELFAQLIENSENKNKSSDEQSVVSAAENAESNLVISQDEISKIQELSEILKNIDENINLKIEDQEANHFGIETEVKEKLIDEVINSEDPTTFKTILKYAPKLIEDRIGSLVLDAIKEDKKLLIVPLKKAYKLIESRDNAIKELDLDLPELKVKEQQKKEEQQQEEDEGIPYELQSLDMTSLDENSLNILIRLLGSIKSEVLQRIISNLIQQHKNEIIGRLIESEIATFDDIHHCLVLHDNAELDPMGYILEHIVSGVIDIEKIQHFVDEDQNNIMHHICKNIHEESSKQILEKIDVKSVGSLSCFHKPNKDGLYPHELISVDAKTNPEIKELLEILSRAGIGEFSGRVLSERNTAEKSHDKGIV